MFADYIGLSQEPPKVNGARAVTISYYAHAEHAIYLSRWGQDLDTVIHETLHAVLAKGTGGSGHDGHFVALTLDAWKHYVPIIDVAAARLAAGSFGVQVEDVVPVRARARDATGVLWSLVCTEPVRSKAYCDALSGSMRSPNQPPVIEGVVQPVHGSGQINDQNRYYALIRDGSLFTALTSDARAAEDPEVVAHFRVTCFRNVLRVEVWWEWTRGLSSSVLVRIGDGDFKRQQWKGTRGRWLLDSPEYDSRVVSVEGVDADKLARDLMWSTAAGESVTIQVRSGSDSLTATFDLDGLFDTPVQPNIARCGREAD